MTGVKRESAVMGKTLLRFVRQTAALAQKLTDAAVIQVSFAPSTGTTNQFL